MIRLGLIAGAAVLLVGGALAAEKVIFLTDVPGLLIDVDDPESLIPRSTVAELRAQIESGVISGGMVPKVESCINAVEAGAAGAHLLDGRVPHVLLLELFTDAGIGTMITAAGAGESDTSDPDAALQEPHP